MAFKPVMNLNKLFYPRALAVVGASNTEGKLGYNVMRNLLDHGFQGRIFPVNPKSGEVQGVKAYPSVSAIDEEIDAAVTIVPAAVTPQVVEECFRNGIEFVTVEAAGFGEIGEKGKVIEEELLSLVNEYGGRLLGPNCTGVINVSHGLCESIGLVGELRSGNVGLVAQAGVYAAGILWGLRAIMDFSMIATIGNKLDLNETDILEFMGQDNSVQVVAMYLEDVRDGKRFLEVAREVVKRKPVIVLKGGRTEAGQAKAVTHTAAIGGSREAYQALFEEAGVIQAGDNDHLFDLARGFSKQPLPSGEGMMVITYSGSQGITTTDTLSENGLRVADLSRGTRKRMQEWIPEMVAAVNPADLTFDQYPEQVRALVEIAVEDGSVGGIIVNLQPEILGSYLEWFEDLDTGEKPLLISVSEREFVMEDVKAMERLGFPVYSTPERAAQVISSMYHFAHREIIEGQEREFQVDRGKVRRIIDDCVSDGREAIGGAEAFEVLEAYGILVMGYSVASSPEEAAAAAQRFGGPVAMKIESGKVLHKSDLGGVELGVEDPVEAYTRIVDRVLSRREDLSREDIQGVCVQPMAAPGRETLIGASWEEGMGCHVIKFGYGGKYTELFQDVALRIAPLDDARARAMVDDTRLIGPLLRGIRGDEPSDVEAVIDTLLRLSQLITDFPEIEQVEANPFTVGGEGAAVLDARFALGEVQSDGSKSPGSKVKDPAVDASP